MAFLILGGLTCKKTFMRFVCFLLIGLSLLPNFIIGQDSTIVIGVKHSPPFVNLHEGRNPEGLSVAFWDLVENDVAIAFEYREFTTLPELLTALQKGEVDMSINPITVTDERMQTIDFSQPFFISGTALVRKYQSNWWGMLSNFFSWKFFSAVAVLLLVIFIFGLLIWHFEKKKNKEQFGKGLTGLADGFWWSAVTMTTVGYGDKAPVTRGGRIVGFIWMFAAILLISGLTASIASALTVQSLDSKISSAEDLRKYGVGTIGGSSSAAYLDLFEVGPQQFTSVEEGLRAVEAGDLDVFVYDRPILSYHMRQMDLDHLVLSPKNLKTDYYSFSFPKGNGLRDKLDPLVVRALKSEQWSFKLKRLEDE